VDAASPTLVLRQLERPWPPPCPGIAVGGFRRLRTALLVSLLLHLGLLLQYARHRSPTPLPPAPQPRLVVTLAGRTDDAVPPATVPNTGAAMPARTETAHRGHSSAAAVAPIQATSLPGSSAPPGGQDVSIDIETARDAARRLAASQVRTGERRYADAPSALDQATPLGSAIARSSRPDCRDAHAGAGLLAIPLLAADAIRSKGCKW
jgi:hypothetical protein